MPIYSGPVSDSSLAPSVTALRTRVSALEVARAPVSAVLRIGFRPDTIVVSASGKLAPGRVELQGAAALVVSVPGLIAGTATVIDAEANAYVEDERVVVTFADEIPQAGAVHVLLVAADRPVLTKTTTAPAPPTAFAFVDQAGTVGALSMVVDALAEVVRIEASDSSSRTGDRSWTVLRDVAVEGAGALAVPLTIGEDVAGRRFRARAVRAGAEGELVSAPSPADGRNRAPVSVGAAAASYPTGGKVARLDLAALVSDPDGGVLGYRLEPLDEGERLDGLTVDGDALFVETTAPRPARTVLVTGTDDRGAEATAELTVTVYTPSGPDQPTAFVYLFR